MPKLIFTAILIALSFTLHAQQGKPVGTVTIEGDGDNSYDPAADTVSTGKAAPEQVYYYVDKMPVFPGGMAKYVKKNLHCSKAVSNAEVTLTFIVKADGTLTDVMVKRGAGTACDDDLMKMLQSMSGWQPGEQNGKKVMVSTLLKLRFEAGKVTVLE